MAVALLIAGLPTRAVSAGESHPQAGADSVARAASPAPLFTRGDAWFGLGAAAAVTAAGFADESVWEHTNGKGPDGLANAVQPLGTPAVLGAAVIGAYAAGRLLGNEELSRASVRGGISLVVAGATTLVIKSAVGRKRPVDSPGEPFEFDPFSGNVSFPSGHATLAFAAASVLDRETRSGWVPWIAYPVAATVGWSRLHDNEHWLSDVVAGAAIGYWVGGKTDDYLRRRDGAVSLGLGLAPSGTPALAARMRF